MTHPIQNSQQISSLETWDIALQWVSANQKLIPNISNGSFMNEYKHFFAKNQQPLC